MVKKDFIVIVIIVVVGISVAYILNISLSYGDLIKTRLPVGNWLDFWGGYSGGVFAAIVGYLAIVYSNRNSEKAIRQQYKLLREQDERKRIEEYVNCLKNNLDAINIAEISKFVGSVDYNNLQISIGMILGKKAMIHSQDIQFNYILSLENVSKRTDAEKQYIKCWNQAITYYFQLLDILVEYVQRIKKNNIENKLKDNFIQQIQTAKQLVNNPIYKMQYEKLIPQYENELSNLIVSIGTYNNDIEHLTNSIKFLTDNLSPLFKQLFELSIPLIKEKNNKVNLLKENDQ